MNRVILALALLGSVTAFVPQTARWNARPVARFAEEAESAPEVAEAEEEAPAPEPEPVPVMSNKEYLESMYGGIGEPETGGKIPPLAYSIAEIGTPGTMDFFRAAELKHGRIAMFGFFGWLANVQNIHFPGYISPSKGVTFADLDAMNGVDAFFGLGPEALGQIFGFVAIFEFYEMTHKDGKWNGNNVLQGDIVPNVNKWDILGFTEGKSDDDATLKRAKLQELKNGRLAMLATLGMCAAATIPGSVPAFAPFF